MLYKKWEQNSDKSYKPINDKYLDIVIIAALMYQYYGQYDSLSKLDIEIKVMNKLSNKMDLINKWYLRNNEEPQTGFSLVMEK